MKRFLLPSFLLALLLTACGQSSQEQEVASDGDDTPYGSSEQVSAYLLEIGPYVQQIGQLQSHYETALASARGESNDRRGTGQNLSDKAKEVRPQLQELLQNFDQIEAPALLAPFHRDMRKLITTRLAAYDKTVDGWASELEGGGHEVLYREVEDSLAEANRLIASLNEEVKKINMALAAAAPPSP